MSSKKKEQNKKKELTDNNINSTQKMINKILLRFAKTPKKPMKKIENGTSKTTR